MNAPARPGGSGYVLHGLKVIRAMKDAGVEYVVAVPDLPTSKGQINDRVLNCFSFGALGSASSHAHSLAVPQPVAPSQQKYLNGKAQPFPRAVTS